MNNFVDDVAFLVKKQDGKYLYSPTKVFNESSCLKIIDDSTRLRIIQMLHDKPMYPAEIAKELKMHEQKVYYHIKQLLNAGVISVASKEEIRGTTAKKYSVNELNFAFSMSNDWKELSGLGTIKKPKKLENFLHPFIQNNTLNAEIIVGSPDPHGPFKARARDSHYSISLALFLGRYCSVKSFAVSLDVDTDIKKTDKNLILVGGPVTNLVVAEVNPYLPIKFSSEKPWGFMSSTNTYSDDSVGLIARIPNPYNPELKILLLAGIRFIGTKAAVIGLSKQFADVLASFNNQKSWATVVQGFDMDGDGKIDSVEILE